MTCEPEEPEN